MVRERGARPTVNDVAAAAGVSRALVSIVMRGVPGASDATRERVLRIADDMGYVPDQRASKLRSASSTVLGVCFELREPFHGDLVEEIYAAAAELGRNVVISAVAPSRSESVAVQTLLSERCESAILLGTRLSAADLTDLAEQLPVVTVLGDAVVETVGDVRGDDAAGIGLAVDHLVALGHRDIVHVDGGDAPGSRVRRRAFLDAMAGHRRKGAARVVDGGLTALDGVRATRGLLDGRAAPTAILAFNDECASGVIDVLIRSGLRVPEDVSVVGYDDARFAATMPVPLTTVSQDARGLAAHAVASVRSMAEGADPGRVVVPPRLMVRETTAPPSR